MSLAAQPQTDGKVFSGHPQILCSKKENSSEKNSNSNSGRKFQSILKPTGKWKVQLSRKADTNG